MNNSVFTLYLYYNNSYWKVSNMKRRVSLMTRALAMISGGLDSTLAAKLIKDQGIEVIGICFRSYFLMKKCREND